MAADRPGSGLAQRFRRFAERECAGISPLYGELARQVADDGFLLELAARSGPGQPPPNMLFAAIHHLLLRGEEAHPLAEFYPSLTPEPGPPDEAFPAFRDFCRTRAAEIAGLLRRRVVSTNEVQRTACLLPAFTAIARGSPAPLHMIEIGASAGLNLLWDRYGYDYGGTVRAGSEDASIRLSCELRGDHRPPMPGRLPDVGKRLGIDPMPLDPGDPEDAAWLRALIWPEQAARTERLLAALRLAAELRPKLITGDGSALLPNAVASMPPDGTLCVFHSFTQNQLSADARDLFRETLQRVGRARPLFRIGLEWADAPAPELAVTRYDATGAKISRLAFCDAHSAWIDWLHPGHAESGIDQRQPGP